MSDFGEILRKERESRGIALEAITAITKISNRHLVALEREQFELLPGGVFNKGIVRGYARAVGLNEEEWVERYLSVSKASSPAAEDEDSWIQFAENASKGRETVAAERPEMRLRWAGAGLLLLLLAAVSWFAWTYVSNRISAEKHWQATHPVSGARVSGDRTPAAH